MVRVVATPSVYGTVFGGETHAVYSIGILRRDEERTYLVAKKKAKKRKRKRKQIQQDDLEYGAAPPVEDMGSYGETLL